MWGKLLGGVTKPLVEGIVQVTEAVGGNKTKAHAADSKEQLQALRNFGAEFGDRRNRTWWDSAVDGVNRLVRPLFTFGTLYLFYYCIDNPSGFAASMAALALMPAYGWGILGAIVAFWFGGKYVADLRRPKPMKPAELASVLHSLKKIEEHKKNAATASNPST